MCCKVENIAPSFDGIEHLQARPRGYAPAFPGVVCFDVVFFHAEKGRLHARKADAATSIAGSLHGRNMICIAQKGAGEGFSRKRSFRAAKPPGAGDDAGLHGALFVESMCCLKCFALPAIRPVVSRKKRIFFRSLWAGRRGAAASHVTL